MNARRELKTVRRHANSHMSMAVMYEMGGRPCRACTIWVTKVSSDVAPRVTLAGTALTSSQNESHEKHTIKVLGTYVFIKLPLNNRTNVKLAYRNV